MMCCPYITLHSPHSCPHTQASRILAWCAYSGCIFVFHANNIKTPKLSGQTIPDFCQYSVKVLKAFPVPRKRCYTVTTKSPIFCLQNPRFGLFWDVRRTECFQNLSCRSQALLLVGEADCRSGHSQAQRSKKCGVRGVNANKYETGLRAWVKGN